MPTQIEENQSTLALQHKSFWSQWSGYLLAISLVITAFIPPIDLGASLMFLIGAALLAFAGHYVTEGFNLQLDRKSGSLNLHRWHGINAKISDKKFSIPLKNISSLTLQYGSKRTRRLVFQNQEQYFSLTISFSSRSTPASYQEIIYNWLLRNEFNVELKEDFLPEGVEVQ